MTGTVDLNADMGEGYGLWRTGDDAALLDVVTSANVACGFHAGDWDVMAATMSAAAQLGVGIGAHPGFPDLQGFGRRRMTFAPDSIRSIIAYQLGAAIAVARSLGTQVRHLKLHGALANMAAEDSSLARQCYEAALSVEPEIIVMVMAGTAQETAAREIGCNAACEIFADRAYTDEATLVDRAEPGAMIHGSAAAASRVAEMVRAGAIISVSGRRIPARIDSVCLHSDTPGALELSRAVRAALDAEGLGLRRFTGQPI